MNLISFFKFLINENRNNNEIYQFEYFNKIKIKKCIKKIEIKNLKYSKKKNE